jgi:hypothetical protein
MTEIKRDVKQVYVDYECPKCRIGHLRPTGTLLTTDPPQVPHKCNNINCDYMETFNKMYPYVDYEIIIQNPISTAGICRPTIITAIQNWDGTGNPNSHIIPSNNGNNF